MAADAPSAGSGGSVGFMLRAFRYRNYRLFFGGQIVSLTGTWITITATSWLVYRLTHSAALLGVVGFASQFPAFLLTPVAGIFIDRWDRHKVLVATQTLSMLQSFALAFLTICDRTQLVDVQYRASRWPLDRRSDHRCGQRGLVLLH